MMPGSVHWVKLRNKQVQQTERMKSIGMAGLIFHMVGSINIQQGISTAKKHAQTQTLAQVSESGPNMHPQGRNLFRPGQAQYNFAIKLYIIQKGQQINYRHGYQNPKHPQLIYNLLINILRILLQNNKTWVVTFTLPRIIKCNNKQSHTCTIYNNMNQLQLQYKTNIVIYRQIDPPIMQQPYPASYEPQIQKIHKYEQLYRILLSKYHICVSCVYRFFQVMAPKMYSDDKNTARLMADILARAQHKCNQQHVHESYKFMVGEFKVYYDNIEANKDRFCWLCSGILQHDFLQQCSVLIMRRVMEQLYGHKQKYKLNTKIHNLFAIKFQIFCNLALAELEKLQIMSKQTVAQIQKQLIVPLFEKTGLDLKTVYKWKLSNIINQQPAEVFTLTSTINEDEQTVIASLQVNHNSHEIEKAMTNLLGPLMQFEKTKTKKGRIQLTQNVSYQANWTVGLINKIAQVGSNQWLALLQHSSVDKLKAIEQQSAQFVTIKLQLQSQNIYFAGRYVKFSRYLSQTPWVVNKERLTQSSMQEEVQRKILRLFYPDTIPQAQIDIKFHAGGREDIDVRMLKGGRPFVLQFVSPRRTVSDVSIQQILDRIQKEYPVQFKSLPQIRQIAEQEQELIKCNLLQFYINTSTQLAKVNGFHKTTSSYISKQLKQAEIEKIKHYVCYIKSEQQFEQGDRIKLESCYNLAVVQKTPVRVLHRRTLMYRDKIVHKMIFHHATKHSAVLEIWASAGTYIKQFVHGDLNRTMPNVGSILGKAVDILQLDVGSLKEGEWVEGDDQHMKLGQLEWEKVDILQ